MSNRKRLMATLLLGTLGSSVHALEVGGVVRSGGEPVPGVMITIQNLLTGNNGEPASVTLVSDRQGRYAMTLDDRVAANDLVVRAARLGFVTAGQSRVVGKDSLRVDFDLSPTDNIAGQAPPSAWLGEFPLDDRDARFVVGQCAGCHGFPDGKVQHFASNLRYLGSGGQLAPKEIRTLHENAWRAAVQYMRVMTFYYAPGMAPRWGFDDQSADFAALLTPEFGLFTVEEEDAAATAITQYLPLDYSHLHIADYPAADTPLALNAGGRIEEFDLRTGGWTREVAWTPGSNFVWIVEDSADRLGRLNPNTAEISWLDLPGAAEGPQGPHTINAGRDGSIWISLEESYGMARFEPADESWRVYPGFGQGAIAHDTCLDHERYVKFDQRGRLWLTLIGENKLAELDLETGDISKYPMPHKAGETPFHAALYGCVMASDGEMIWISQLNGIVGGFNTRTKQLETVIDLPFGAIPHRFAIDDNDIIYVALSGDGQVLVYDTRARKELRRLDLPDRNSAPYATTWDPYRRVVWVAASNSDAIYRIDPETGEGAVVPLPRKRTYLRMIDIDRRNGDLWTTYAPLPIGRGPNFAVRVVPGDEVNAAAYAARH